MMEDNNQYTMDVYRLAELLNKHTGIPIDRTCEFVLSHGAGSVISRANELCETAGQREKLNSLIEFKHMLESIKSGDPGKVYRLDTPEAGAGYFSNHFALNSKEKEHFVVAYLNSRLEVIMSKVASEGTINQAAVYPRELIKDAIFCNASRVMVAHNHPSGDLDVSVYDKEVTEKLRNAFKSVDMQLLDHFIVSAHGVVSVDDPGRVMNPQNLAESIVKEQAAEYKQSASYIPLLPAAIGTLELEPGDICYIVQIQSRWDPQSIDVLGGWGNTFKTRDEALSHMKEQGYYELPEHELAGAYGAIMHIAPQWQRDCGCTDIPMHCVIQQACNERYYLIKSDKVDWEAGTYHVVAAKEIPKHIPPGLFMYDMSAILKSANVSVRSTEEAASMRAIITAMIDDYKDYCIDVVKSDERICAEVGQRLAESQPQRMIDIKEHFALQKRNLMSDAAHKQTPIK